MKNCPAGFAFDAASPASTVTRKWGGGGGWPRGIVSGSRTEGSGSFSDKNFTGLLKFRPESPAAVQLVAQLTLSR